MPLPGIGAAQSFLDELQRDLLETEDQDFDEFFDRWSAFGLPEIEEYRSDRRRSRGELISEINRTNRAIEVSPEILQVETAGETPIMAGVRRIARGAEVLQGLVDGAIPWGHASGAASNAAPMPRMDAALYRPAEQFQSFDLVPVMARRRRYSASGGGEIAVPPDLFFGGGVGPMLGVGAALGAAAAAGELMDQERRRRGHGGGDLLQSARPDGSQLQFPPDADQWSQESQITPPIPGMTEPEVFPADERQPQIEVFPAIPREPDIKIFPIPELPQVQAEVFLALSDEVIRQLARPMEAHRGDKFTRRGNDIVVQKTYEVLARWFPDITVKHRFHHTAGATEFGEGKKELKERFVWDKQKGSYSIPDIIVTDTETGRRIALNTGETLKDGRTLIAGERGQLERLRKKLEAGEMAGGLPKLRPVMDESAYGERVEGLLIEVFTRYFGKPPGG